jgi:hypothetical protein
MMQRLAGPGICSELEKARPGDGRVIIVQRLDPAGLCQLLHCQLEDYNVWLEAIGLDRRISLGVKTEREGMTTKEGRKGLVVAEERAILRKSNYCC